MTKPARAAGSLELVVRLPATRNGEPPNFVQLNLGYRLRKGRSRPWAAKI
ncbi:MAG: hypothetical protein IPI24_05365 [Ignavibacteria bacterium]|nr:hypothetical protein [Ignavibacteria bacterium]